MRKKWSKFKNEECHACGVIVCVLCLVLTSCSKDVCDISEDKELKEETREAFFSIEEAKTFFENSGSPIMSSRVSENTKSHYLVSGDFTPKWETAVIAESKRLASANIPISSSYRYLASLRKNQSYSSFVEVFQKLIIIKSKKTGRYNNYILWLIPDSTYYAQNKDNVCNKFINSGDKGKYSGMAIYTKINGHIPATVAIYKNGKRVDKASLLDTTRSLNCRVKKMKELLKNVRFKRDVSTTLSRASTGTGTGTGAGTGTGTGTGTGESNEGDVDPGENEEEDWDWANAEHYGWDDELEMDLWLYKNNGETYFIADTDNDGKPDRIWLADADAFPDDPDDDDPRDDDEYVFDDEDDDPEDDDEIIDNQKPDSPGDDGSAIIPKDPAEYIVTLSVSSNRVELCDEYNLDVVVYDQNSNDMPIIASVDYGIRIRGMVGLFGTMQMKNANDGDPTQYTRRAVVSGFHELQAEVYIQGLKDPIASNVVVVEEMFPSFDKFKDLPMIHSRAMDLWEKSVTFAKENKAKREAREFGCFIFLNPETGDYYCGPDIPGNIIKLDNEVKGTVFFSYPNTPVDPRVSYHVQVGALHSHYPLTWALSTIIRRPGPSDDDSNFSLPGIVYDYSDIVYGGDPVVMKGNPLKLYEYGPDRRSTLKR